MDSRTHSFHSSFWAIPCCMLALSVCLPLAGLAQERPRSVGYFVEWGVFGRDYHVADLPCYMLTHINYAFVVPVYHAPRDEGSIEFYDAFAAVEKLYPGDDPQQPVKGNMHQLALMKARYPHIKTLLSVGGYTLSDDFSDIAASSNARRTFAESCVSFVTTYGFDGLDIDWEYPVQGGETGLTHRAEDADNLLLLLADLRAALDDLPGGTNRLLTIAASASPSTLHTRYRLPQLAQHLDWINVMTYDMAGPWDPLTGHQAPLYANPSAPHQNLSVDGAIQAYRAAGVAAGKLVVGTAFYGHGLKGVSDPQMLFVPHTGASDEGTWNPGEFEFRDLADGTQGNAAINTNGFIRYWDDHSKVPYLYNEDTQVFITYEDPRSLELKARYVRDQGLGGIMFWAAEMDTARRDLVGTMERILNPFGLRMADVGGAGLPELSWFGLPGQSYEVQTIGMPGSSNWTPMTNFSHDGSVLGTVVTGANRTVSVIDMGAQGLSSRFYRLAPVVPGE